MKLSNFWSSWSRSVLVLAVMLGFFGWTPTPANAAIEYRDEIPFVDDFDACSGERVSIDGIQTILGRFTTDREGRLHFGFTRHTKGTGIGQTSGDEYIMTDAYTRASLELTSGEVKTFSQQFNGRLIRRGEELANDDTIIHFLSKFIIDANGEITTIIDIQGVECR
jgi:hypothetical protein